jgi:hypothetical protein
MGARRFIFKNIGLLVTGFIFLVLFLLPVLFTKIDGHISWHHVIKIWKDDILLVPLFFINHYLLVPRILLRKKYISYFCCIIGLIFVFATSYYFYDNVLKRPLTNQNFDLKRPAPVPPYANLLMYSLLIAIVDTGMSFSKKWFEDEEKRFILERKNAEIQLEFLKNQVSPHFFMNTLNNIYALIDRNSEKAKESVMKLSRLMRYMLYENSTGKVKLTKEFEFIISYIDLMKLRFTDEVQIKLFIPENYPDISVPPLLFISYIENAFKYGASYENNSLIEVLFEINDNKLLFRCSNTYHSSDTNAKQTGGIGLINTENRLKILYGKNFALSTQSLNDTFIVTLVIPLL